MHHAALLPEPLRAALAGEDMRNAPELPDAVAAWFDWNVQARVAGRSGIGSADKIYLSLTARGG